jgi:adenylylsulfate kinase
MSKKLFIGRWSPFHAGHKYIVDSYVANGLEVCIAVRDTPLDIKNPYSADLRKRMIEAVYAGNDLVSVIVIPDIDTVCVGRGVGYAIMQVPENIENISATAIRAGECFDWPEEAQAVLREAGK